MSPNISVDEAWKRLSECFKPSETNLWGFKNLLISEKPLLKIGRNFFDIFWVVEGCEWYEEYRKPKTLGLSYTEYVLRYQLDSNTSVKLLYYLDCLP